MADGPESNEKNKNKNNMSAPNKAHDAGDLAAVEKGDSTEERIPPPPTQPLLAPVAQAPGNEERVKATADLQTRKSGEGQALSAALKTSTPSSSSLPDRSPPPPPPSTTEKEKKAQGDATTTQLPAIESVRGDPELESLLPKSSPPLPPPPMLPEKEIGDEATTKPPPTESVRRNTPSPPQPSSERTSAATKTPSPPQTSSERTSAATKTPPPPEPTSKISSEETKTPPPPEPSSEKDWRRDPMADDESDQEGMSLSSSESADTASETSFAPATPGEKTSRPAATTKQATAELGLSKAVADLQTTNLKPAPKETGNREAMAAEVIVGMMSAEVPPPTLQSNRLQSAAVQQTTPVLRDLAKATKRRQAEEKKAKESNRLVDASKAPSQKAQQAKSKGPKVAGVAGVAGTTGAAQVTVTERATQPLLDTESAVRSSGGGSTVEVASHAGGAEIADEHSDDAEKDEADNEAFKIEYIDEDARGKLTGRCTLILTVILTHRKHSFSVFSYVQCKLKNIHSLFLFDFWNTVG